MVRQNGSDTVDQLIAETDQDETLNRMHSDAMRTLVHVLRNSSPEAAQKLQVKLAKLSELQYQAEDRSESSRSNPSESVHGQ